METRRSAICWTPYLSCIIVMLQPHRRLERWEGDLADASHIFKMAIGNFWGATQQFPVNDRTVLILVALQQFCYAVQTANDSKDPLLQFAIDHLWSAQGQTGDQQLATMATGPQQFCAGVKNLYYT